MGRGMPLGNNNVGAVARTRNDPNPKTAVEQPLLQNRESHPACSNEMAQPHSTRQTGPRVVACCVQLDAFTYKDLSCHGTLC